MFECFLEVERSKKESFFLAGVTLRVIGRRAVSASVALPKMNAWNCVHSREVHHSTRSLYSTSTIAEGAAFSLFWETNPDSAQNLPEE